jgi:hypothetical protein
MTWLDKNEILAENRGGGIMQVLYVYLPSLKKAS